MTQLRSSPSAYRRFGLLAPLVLLVVGLAGVVPSAIASPSDVCGVCPPLIPLPPQLPTCAPIPCANTDTQLDAKCVGLVISRWCPPGGTPGGPPLGHNPPICCYYGRHWEPGRNQYTIVEVRCNPILGVCPGSDLSSGTTLLGSLPEGYVFPDSDLDGVPDPLDLLPFQNHPDYDTSRTLNPQGAIPVEFTQNPVDLETFLSGLGVDFSSIANRLDKMRFPPPDINNDNVCQFVEVAAELVHAGGEAADFVTQQLKQGHYGGSFAGLTELLKDDIELLETINIIIQTLGLMSYDDLVMYGFDRALVQFTEFHSALTNNIDALEAKIELIQSTPIYQVVAFTSFMQVIVPGISTAEVAILLYGTDGLLVDHGQGQAPVAEPPSDAASSTADPVSTATGSLYYEVTDFAWKVQDLT